MFSAHMRPELFAALPLIVPLHFLKYVADNLS
jgi:hypothetical protein